MAVEEITRIAARVPTSLVKDAEAIAKREDRTLSYIVRQALRVYVEADQNMNRKAA